MKIVDQIIQPRWLATMAQNARADAVLETAVLEDHAVAVNQDTIVAIADVDTIKAEYESANWVELDQHLLIPGLVNTHTHAAMTLLRGYADDLPLQQWLNEHIWPAEAQWVDASFVEAGTNLAIAEMLLGGTTCFNDMYFFPDVSAKCAENAGIRACVGLIVIDFPSAWASGTDDYISRGLAVRDSIRHSNLLTCAFAPHAPYTVGDEAFEKIAVFSEELDCRIHIHLHETPQEITESLERFGMRPIERLDGFGLLTHKMLAVHATQLLPEEIEIIASRGVNVVHCPRSNLKLASGNCQVKKLMDAGINVCLGTDGASSNNNLDMIGELNVASLLAKGISHDPTALGAYQALAAATINGARALGLDDKIGSIEVGKQADMVAVDLFHPATQPVFNPLSQLVYAASASQVSDVWIAGAVKVRAGELTDICLRDILFSADVWRQKMTS